MATFVEISVADFESFIYGTLGFNPEHNPMTFPGVREKVYGRVCQVGNQRYSVRIYSSVDGSKARGVGRDAIRVEVYYKNSDGVAVRLGGSKRVHRVEGWRANLQNRIDNWTQALGPCCPTCGAPTKIRKPKVGQTWKEFHGCVIYPKCKGVYRVRVEASN